MEVVAAFHNENVVAFLYGCGKLALGSSLLKFEWLVALVFLRLSLCSRRRGDVLVYCVVVFRLHCWSCEVPKL
jgi:hypothetical protein